ncbi:MAG: hypothetical protein ABI411_07970 [Tahibacter sp.]
MWNGVIPTMGLRYDAHSLGWCGGAAMGSEQCRLRLVAAQATEQQLRELVQVLLAQGDALLASRSWRIGSAVTGAMARCARLLGGAPPVPQSARHWHEIVDAHYDRLQRQQVLLEQLCARDDVAENADAVLARFWVSAGGERVLTGSA